MTLLWYLKLLEGFELEHGLCHSKTGKLWQPSSKWVPVSNQERIRQREERNGLCISYAVLKIQGLLASTALKVTRLWETKSLLYVIHLLTLKVPITTAADNIYKYFSIFFQRK